MCERAVPRLRAWDALRNGLFALEEQFVFPRSESEQLCAIKLQWGCYTHLTQPGRKWDEYSKGCWKCRWPCLWSTFGEGGEQQAAVPQSETPPGSPNRAPPKPSRGKHRGNGAASPSQERNPGGNQHPENSPLRLPPFCPGAVYRHWSLMSTTHSSPGWGHRGRSRSAGRAAGMDSGSDTFPERCVRRRRRRRRRRAAAVAERSRPAQLLSRGGTHGLVTFDIFCTIF